MDCSNASRQRPGKLLGQQAGAGNLGQALGSMGAGSLFTLAPMMPFWTAALILLVGAALSLAWWGPARLGEIAARETTGTGPAGR